MINHDGDRATLGKASDGDPKNAHSLTLDGKKRLEVTGVKDVTRFDEWGAELATVLGSLAVDGSGLRLEAFDTERGFVLLTGEIRGLDYFDSDAEGSGKKRGFFGKR